jgi:hypothetical protein
VNLSAVRFPGPRGPETGLLFSTAAVLLVGLFGALAVSFWAGVAFLALGLVMLVRPLDLFVSLLLVASVAAFAEYGDLRIRRDLAVVGLLGLYALASFTAAWVSRRWGLPVSRLTPALLALAITTGVAVLHGLAARNTVRFMSLELFPLLALYVSLAVGGLRLTPGELRVASRTYVAVGLATSAIGFVYFAVTGSRAQGLPFSPIPGLVALVILNLELYRDEPRPRLIPVLLICLLVFHQILTFTRGFWLALLVGIPFSCVVYARRGAGWRQRWSKVAHIVGLVALVLVAGGAILGVWLGLSDVIGMLGGRFASSFDTKNTPETVSNIVRLVELRTSLMLIVASPWLGYGHGFTLVVRQFFYPLAGAQWWVHESYVMIWLKQGIFGLLALLWVLFAALRLGLRGASHPDRQLAGWCAASAACTVFAAVIGLTNYYFFMVTQNFLLAVLWGISIVAGEPERSCLVWRVPPVAPSDGRADGEGSGA